MPFVASGYTRDGGEGKQKVHQEGSLRRDLKFLKSEPADDFLYRRVRTLMVSVGSASADITNSINATFSEQVAQGHGDAFVPQLIDYLDTQ